LCALIYYRVMRRQLAVSTVALAACVLSSGLLAAGAAAHAAGRVAHPAATAPTHTVAPARAGATLYLYDAFFVDKKTVDVPGRTLRVTGYVSHYVPDQKVTVSARLGAKRIARKRVRIVASKHGTSGEFVVTLHPGRAGILHLRAVHARSPKLQGFSAGRGVEILPESTRSELYTKLVQRRLARLHIYLPQTGVWDAYTGWAVDAYHRLIHDGTSPVLDHATLMDLLDGKGAFTVRDPQDGTHVEGDLTTQLLALIKGSRVDRIYPISSGKASTPTILGHYRVYLRVPGYLPDGMYYSNFFTSGYAIHGFDPAPDYPASHGCMRLPIADAISVYHWLTLGDVVDVYR
jgi:hypothetical protein